MRPLVAIIIALSAGLVAATAIGLTSYSVLRYTLERARRREAERVLVDLVNDVGSDETCRKRISLTEAMKYLYRS